MSHRHGGGRLADDLGDPGSACLTKTFLPYLMWHQGRLQDAVAMFDEVLALTADNPDIPFKELIGSPRAWALAVRGSILFCLGRPEEGRQGLDDGIRLAAVEDQETLGWTHMFAATVHLSGGEMAVDEVVHHAETCFEIAERLGDAFSRSWARFWLAMPLSWRAMPSGRSSEFTRTLTEIDQRGAGREALSLIHGGLGSALVAAGEVDRGIEIGRRAVTLAAGPGLDTQRDVGPQGRRRVAARTRLRRRRRRSRRAPTPGARDRPAHRATCCTSISSTGSSNTSRRRPDQTSAAGSVTGIRQTKSRQT